MTGGYDTKVAENVEHFKELQDLAEQHEIPSSQIAFLRSISAKKRNRLLHKSLCVIYTPENEHFGTFLS